MFGPLAKLGNENPPGGAGVYQVHQDAFVPQNAGVLLKVGTG